jgi:N-acetylmuramoyl-L-alanine amidase
VVRSAIAAMAACLLAGTASARTVVVDIGHSLAAPGSTGASGTTEFSYNRALGLEVAAEMRRLGWTVLVPNADGRMRSLAARPAAAAAARADLFLSIHHDSVQSWQMPERGSFSGFSTWASGAHPAAVASTRCAGTIGRSMLRGGMRPNLAHGMQVQGEGRDLQDARIGRYRRDDLAVLRLSHTPAVLVEAGVIVNPNEEAWLARPDARAGIARVIAAGADACITDKGARR